MKHLKFSLYILLFGMAKAAMAASSDSTTAQQAIVDAAKAAIANATGATSTAQQIISDAAKAATANPVDYTQQCTNLLSQQNSVTRMNGCWQAMAQQFSQGTQTTSTPINMLPGQTPIPTNLPIASYLVINFSKDSGTPIQIGFSSMGFCEPTQKINLFNALKTVKIKSFFDNSGMPLAAQTPPAALTFSKGTSPSLDTITVTGAVCLNQTNSTDVSCMLPSTTFASVTYYRDLYASNAPSVLNYIQTNNSDATNCPFDSNIFSSTTK